MAEKILTDIPVIDLTLDDVSSDREYDKQMSNRSSEVNTSTKEFLRKEKMCNEIYKNGSAKKEDRSCDLASIALDKYSTDFESVTDQDIGSILEEMSKIAGAMSPTSIPNAMKIGNSNKSITDEERSVEEIIEEAEKLVCKNNCNLSRNVSIIELDNTQELIEAKQRVDDLEAEIFSLIQQEVNKETEKIRNSPRNEQFASSNIQTFTSSSLQIQNKQFEEQKVDVSSSSDLDDPIEKHSKSEELKNDDKKENLKKEISDVDQNFFPDLLKRSIEKTEGGLSGSCSFEQEDFSHFLKLLKAQSNELTDFSEQNFPMKKGDISPGYPEKEIREILEKECMNGDNVMDKVNMTEVPKLGKNDDIIRVAKEEKLANAKKIVNSNNELYNVDLTPRLELFADAIPKLIAEKSIEKENKLKNSLSRDDLDFLLVSKKCEVEPRIGSTPELSRKRKEVLVTKSKSCDQLTNKNVNNQNQKVDKNKGGFQIKPSLIPKNFIKKKPTIVKTEVRTKASTKLNSFTETSKCNSSSFASKSYLKSNKMISDPKKRLDKSEWEILYSEEKHKNQLLKEQIEAEAKKYKAQMESMRVSFEQELFSLKKQNILLKAKTDEKTLTERRQDTSKVALLEKELERQEQLIKAYEAENKKLLHDTKYYQEEIRNLRQKQKNAVDENEIQKLQEENISQKDEILKLSVEASELRQKISDYELKNEDMNHQNSLLNDELDMFKKQLSSKNTFITTRLQAMTTAELTLKKQMEDLKVELSSKTEQLKLFKRDYDKLQHGMLTVEKQMIEMKAKESALQEKLQVTKGYVEREKQLSLKLKDQVILDNSKILDLTRQVKEMERIIKRKNPDSMAALLLSNNSEQEKMHAETVKQLEDKIALLESELKSKDEIAQKHITDLQKRLDETNMKHAVRVSDLEKRIMDLNFSNDRKICSEISTQTSGSFMESKKTEEKNVKSSQKTQNLKEDTHLLATIRGLKIEVSNKDKSIAKLNKDVQELQKTNRRLQREREKFLNEKKNVARSSSMHRMTEVNDQNSNVYQNGHSQRLSSSMQKLYDPLQFSEHNLTNSETTRKLSSENEVLKEELLRSNQQLVMVKNKKIQDLKILQEEHEHEMVALIKDHKMKIEKLKSNKDMVIKHLNDKLIRLEGAENRAAVLMAERDHLEAKVKSLNQKLKYLSTSDTDQLQQLQDELSILKQRHESREKTLQKLVRQLMRSKAQCLNCKGERTKSSQLCYFRQELDQILKMLQEIASIYQEQKTKQTTK